MTAGYNPPPPPKTRRCLKCGNEFNSKSSGNRICTKCNGRNRREKSSRCKVNNSSGKTKQE